MVYENTGQVPNVMTSTGGGDDASRQNNWWGIWIFAIVIIFFALIFMWRRDGDDHRKGYGNGNVGGDALPYMLAAQCMDKRGHGCGCEGGFNGANLWDIERDNLAQFAQTRQEIVTNAFTTQRENDRYFYENRTATDRGFYENRTAIDRNNFDTAIGFKNSEVLGCQNTAALVQRVDALERTLKDDEIRRLSAQNTYLQTTMAVRGLGSVPAYMPQYPMPYCEPAAQGYHY